MITDGNKIIVVGGAVSATGELRWSRRLGGPGTEGLRGIIGLPEGGFVAALYMLDNALLARIDDTGELVWQRQYPRDGDQEIEGMVRTPEGGLWITGSTTEKGILYRGFVQRVDGRGNELGYAVHGNGGFDTLSAVAVLPDGGVVAVGGVETGKANTSKVWLLRTDAWGRSDCQTSGLCWSTGAAACDDGDPCTADSCDAKTGCKHGAISGCLPPAKQDLDHDGKTGTKDACPTVFGGAGSAKSCLPIDAKFAKSRAIELYQPGILAPWSTARRTNEPVEVPLINGIRDDSLRGHWRLAGDAKDTGLFAFHGALQGAPKSTAGPFGGKSGALACDGKQQHVTVPNVGVPTDYTLAAWVRIDSKPSNSMAIIGTYEPGKGAALLHYTHSKGATALTASNYSGGAYPSISYAVALHGTGWRHVASTYEAAEERFNLYLDGKLVATRDAAPAPKGTLGAAKTMLRIGRGHKAYPLHGAGADALLFSRPLAPDELQTYADSRQPYAEPLVVGAQADFDDVRVAEAEPGQPGTAHATHFEVLGARVHSDHFDQHVLAAWRFDGALPDALGKYSSTKKVGTVAFSRGRWGGKGKALALDGKTAINSKMQFKFHTNKAFTIEAWLWLDEAPTGIATIIGSTTDTQFGGQLRLFIGKDLSISGVLLTKEEGGFTLLASKTAKLRLKRWHHVAMRYSKGVISYFLDGERIGSMAFSKKGTIAPVSAAMIGATVTSNSPATDFFTGRIDELIVHGIARSNGWLRARAWGLARVRLLAATAAVPSKGHYRYNDYTLHWGDAKAKPKPLSIVAPGGADTCDTLLSACTGYAA